LFWPGGMGVAYKLIELGNGHFYSVGSYAGSNFPFTPTLYKFDNIGNPNYKRFILQDTISGGEATSICPYRNSDILVGMEWGTEADPAMYSSELFLLDTLGNILDRKLLLNEDRSPECIIKTFNDKILVTGNYVVDNNWDIYLWKLNSDLEFDTLYTQPLTYDSLCPYEIQSDTVDLDCGVFVNIDELPTKEEYESSIKISPNPAREWIALTLPDNISQSTLELTIYNIFGQEVINIMENNTTRIITLDISSLSSGLYFVNGRDTRHHNLKGKFVVAR
jgi:hypothetical protein